MSKKTFENVTFTKVRYKHFHAPRTNERGERVKGDLIATIAAADMEDGRVAVGIARVNPEDQPRRDIGRAKALHRLKRLVAINTNQIVDAETRKRESKKMRREAHATLSLFMTAAEFQDRYLHGNPFSQAIDFADVLVEINDDAQLTAHEAAHVGAELIKAG